MGHSEHRRAGPASVPCAVVTVSDTRDASTDRSGAFILRALRGAGHRVHDYRIITDDPPRIVKHLRGLAAARKARVVLLSGGTGITPRDQSYEAVSGLLEKRLDGFGEIFRALSFRGIGPAAMLSRAVAGTFGGMVIFSMPGSENAVRLAMTRMILPELGHAAELVAPRGRGKAEHGSRKSRAR